MDGFLLLLEVVAKPLLAVFLVISALVGLTALISPRAFELITTKGNQWVDTWRFFRIVDVQLFRRLDKWIDLDSHAVRHSRVTGILLLASAALMAGLLVLN